MAIGLATSVTPGSLNQSFGNYAVALRDVCADIQQLWSWIETLGASEAAQVAALAALGTWQVQGTDPQAFWTAANNAYAVSQGYYGQITLPNDDYDTALAAARGGS